MAKDMIATHAFDHKDWLKSRGFKWDVNCWKKTTDDPNEIAEVQQFAREKFKLQVRPAGMSQFDWEEHVERQRQIERIESERSKTGKMDLSDRDKFYVPGSGSVNEPKPYARYARAPFTGHEPAGHRSAINDLPPVKK